MENLNTLNLPNELMLCHHQEEGAGEDLDRVYDPMIFFVRENRTQVDHLLCMWMTLLQLKVKKWSPKMEYPHQNGHSKYHRRFLLVAGFQAIEEDEVLFTVKIGFLHHLLQKGTTVVGREQEAPAGAPRILLEATTTRVAGARAISTGALCPRCGRSALQAIGRVLGTELLGVVGVSGLPGPAPTAAVEAPEESSLVEAVVEVVTYGPSHDEMLLGTLSVYRHFTRTTKIRHRRTNLDLAIIWRHLREYFYLKKADFV